MKKIGSAILSCVLCFSIVFALQAQTLPTIIAPTAIVPPSTIYKANIKVAHFKKIVGVQFTVKWNTNVLRFKEVRDFTLSLNPQVESFGLQKTADGMLAFQWYDESLQGRSLDDSTTLFSINFEVIGTPAAISPLSFTDDIALREIADSSLNEVDAKYLDGAVRVDAATSTHVYNSAPHLVQVEDSYPNPFHEFTQVKLELKAASQVRLLIQNTQGQTIHEEQRFMASGLHTLRLTKEMFPVPGAYQYLLVSPDFVITQKLIFL
ncbi:MAG: cohesin domain-containing protein [Saprospiraceae bacterium]